MATGTICYLNTDLDLTSVGDLTGLAAVFDSHGATVLDVSKWEDGLWRARFKMLEQQTEPELNIAAMVSVVESFGEPQRSVWQDCTQREFNIGYECGAEPRAFNQGLSNELLRRMAAIGASLRVRLYPARQSPTRAY